MHYLQQFQSIKTGITFGFAVLILTTSTNLLAEDGAAIYKKSCFACHDSGVAGSPKIGDQAAWASRLKQSVEVLSQHAIDGYTGATGVMPAKGGFSNLSDEEVIAAVEYMIEQSK